MNDSSKKPVGPGCDVFDPGSLPLEAAVAEILAAVPTPTQSKSVKLRKTFGRVLAENIQAPADVPNHTNSAMDANTADRGPQGFLQKLGLAPFE